MVVVVLGTAASWQISILKNCVKGSYEKRSKEKMTYQSTTQEHQRGTETQVSSADASLFMTAWGQYSFPEAHLPKGHLLLCTALMRNFALCLESCSSGWAVHPEYTPSIPTAWLCPVQTFLCLKPPHSQAEQCLLRGCWSPLPVRGLLNNLWRTEAPPK